MAKKTAMEVLTDFLFDNLDELIEAELQEELAEQEEARLATSLGAREWERMPIPCGTGISLSGHATT